MALGLPTPSLGSQGSLRCCLKGSNVSSCVVLFLFSWVGLVGRPRAGARRVGSPAGARRKDPPGRVSSTPRLRCLRRPLFDRQTSNSPLGVKGSTAQSGRAVRRGDLIGPPRRPAGEPAACVRLLVLIFFLARCTMTDARCSAHSFGWQNFPFRVCLGTFLSVAVLVPSSSLTWHIAVNLWVLARSWRTCGPRVKNS